MYNTSECNLNASNCKYTNEFFIQTKISFYWTINYSLFNFQPFHIDTKKMYNTHSNENIIFSTFTKPPKTGLQSKNRTYPLLLPPFHQPARHLFILFYFHSNEGVTFRSEANRTLTTALIYMGRGLY